ncbi:MAG: guanylate kinase [Oscillospiraceae bacterium]
MMNKQGSLILLIGPSGSGKGTILKELLLTPINTFLSVSATTRKPRPGETDGESYFFLKQDKFKELIATDSMLEYANYCGNFYGTPKTAVLDRISKGENVILEIEVQGAKQIKKMYPTAVLIFIIPPSLTELKHRLIDRNTEDKETVKARLNAALDEIKFAYECDYVVINDTISKAVEEIKAIISAQSCSSHIMKEFIDEVLRG